MCTLVYTYFQFFYSRPLLFLKIASVSAIIVFKNSKLTGISEGSTSSIDKPSRRPSPLLRNTFVSNYFRYKHTQTTCRKVYDRELKKKLDQFTTAHHKKGYKQDKKIKALKASITTHLKLLKTFANYRPL